MGWILISNGDTTRGLPLMRQAVAQAGSDPRILYHYAVALKDTGERDEAIKMLNAVVANKGQFSEKIDAQKLLDQLKQGIAIAKHGRRIWSGRLLRPWTRSGF